MHAHARRSHSASCLVMCFSLATASAAAPLQRGAKASVGGVVVLRRGRWRCHGGGAGRRSVLAGERAAGRSQCSTAAGAEVQPQPVGGLEVAWPAGFMIFPAKRLLNSGRRFRGWRTDIYFKAAFLKRATGFPVKSASCCRDLSVGPSSHEPEDQNPTRTVFVTIPPRCMGKQWMMETSTTSGKPVVCCGRSENLALENVTQCKVFKDWAWLRQLHLKDIVNCEIFGRLQVLLRFQKPVRKSSKLVEPFQHNETPIVLVHVIQG